jgi:hypothetical protein
VQALRQANRGFSVMFEPLGEFLSVLEAVIQPIQRSRCRNVGQELLTCTTSSLMSFAALISAIDRFATVSAASPTRFKEIRCSRTEMKVNPSR